MGTVSALDVAKYVLQGQAAPVTTMKLQKLVYYSQAWHLAWTGKPLFSEEIQAWANGPVVYELFRAHRGKFSISCDELDAGNAAALNDAQKGIVDTVVGSYDKLTASQLSMLTHSEDPWKVARGNTGLGENSSSPIDQSLLRDFYSALQQAEGVVDPADAFASA